MKVIDTHVHLWDRSVSAHSWMEGTDLAHALGPGDLPTAAPLERQVILVEVASDPASAMSEAHWFSQLVEQQPNIIGFVANLPFTGDVAVMLGELATLPGWCGVRWLFQDSETVFDDPASDRALSLVAEAGVPFDVCVRHHQLGRATELLSRNPGLTVVLDHCGKPPLTEPELLDQWADQVTRFARLPHSYVKLSGLTGERGDLTEQQASPLYRQVVQHCLQTFGEDRCLVGSDWPISPLVDGRGSAWFEFVADLADPWADQVLAGTAARVYQPRSGDVR